jgi:cyclophilin family peptidyl-prolyl cis-trans isomerase
MARTNDPDSATAQFFINVADNARGLDPRPGSAGYTVFGKVVEGMDVVDAIVGVRTQSRGNHDDVPVEPIVIQSAKRKGK